MHCFNGERGDLNKGTNEVKEGKQESEKDEDKIDIIPCSISTGCSIGIEWLLALLYLIAIPCKNI
jgi:hypothetical protein